MKRFFFWVLALHSQFSFCQSADFITQLTFRYDKGHYTFGHSGQYAISEIIEYLPADKNFRIVKHLQIKKFYDSTSNKIHADTSVLKISRSPVSTSIVDNLLLELNTSRNNYTAAFLKTYLLSPSRKEVRTIAGIYDQKWKFEKEYSDRSERRTVFSEIKHLNRLDSFLQKVKPSQNSDLLITIDLWNRLSITCAYGKDTIEYRADFFELPAQPIIRYDNRDYMTFKQAVNLQANVAIRSLVPQSSLIYKMVDLNGLKPKYIAWYLENYF